MCGINSYPRGIGYSVLFPASPARHRPTSDFQNMREPVKILYLKWGKRLGFEIKAADFNQTPQLEGTRSGGNCALCVPSRPRRVRIFGFALNGYRNTHREPSRVASRWHCHL